MVYGTTVADDLGAAIELDMDQTEYSEEHGQISNKVVDATVTFILILKQ